MTYLSRCREIISDDELCDILSKIYKNRLAQIKSQQYFESIGAVDNSPPMLTPEEYRIVFEENYQFENKRKFIYNENNREIVRALCLYFAQDEEFEKLKENFSLKKGILLTGGVGVGKTSIMKAFRMNPIKSYGVVRCQTVVNAYLEDAKAKEDAKSKYEFYTTPNRNISRVQSYGQEFFGWMYDDLGTENQANSFGNKLNVMADVIDKICNNTDMFGRCHITTNLTGDQIEDLYGERIRSRIRSMFNGIQFPATAKDMRI